MTGADALLRALSEQGVEVIFGNPGSTELPIMDALARPGAPRFVLGLTEPAVVGMADGYAQAAGRLGVALVHVQPGMANALSGVLNAARARVPLLIIVGQQVSSMLPGAPFLGGDIVGMAQPLTRYAQEVTRPAELGSMLHAAVAAALGPPAGPSVLSVPLECQAGRAAPIEPLPAVAATLPLPDASLLDRTAELMQDAASPVILAGDGIAHSGAEASLAALARRLGAPVMAEPFAARLVMATDDPLWAGPMPRFAADIRTSLAPYDLAIAIGMPVFRLFGWSPGAALPPDTRLVHVDVDQAEIGRSHAPDAGIVGDPALVIAALLERVGAPDPAANARRERHGADLGARRRGEADALAVRASGGPAITGAALSLAVGAAVPPDALVVDEGITATRDLRVALGTRRPGSVLWHRGSALGWGLPAAVGAAIADPSRPVVCAQGDGSLMFGVHALWTAAHERCRIALVVGDNSGYEILRAGMEGLTGDAEGPWPGLAVADPALDIPAICRGFGASARYVHGAQHVAPAVSECLQQAERGPAVLVARVEGLSPAVGGPLDGAPGVA